MPLRVNVELPRQSARYASREQTRQAVLEGVSVWADALQPALPWFGLEFFEGDPTAPIHGHVATRYLEESGEEIGIPNVVTSVLASYRGYDTLGEVTVIFTAGVGVIALLGLRRRRRNEKDAG